MIFDILQLGFSAFVCYCLYLVVIVPHQEKKKKEMEKLSVWLSKLEQK